MSSEKLEIRYDGKEVICLSKWKVRVGVRIGQSGHLLFTYRNCNDSLEPIGDTLRYKCKKVGVIVDSLVKTEGQLVVPNDVLIQYTECLHNTVMKDLCADCGANINALDADQRQRIAALTSVSMVHSVPELRVSLERAETLGRADERRLLTDRKLVLLVDLDQTLIHSTNQNIPHDMPDVHHFQLYGPHTQWYHTKFRPNTIPFLQSMSKLFELHICTFGARRYAHSIAHLIDPKELFFPKDRILSRDECFDPYLKTGNMKSLFPCGDAMVCIIDDREDVWNFAPNLVAVKPYVCFRDTGDINAPEKAVPDMFGNQVMTVSNKTEVLKEFTKNEKIIEKDEHLSEREVIENPNVETKDFIENKVESKPTEEGLTENIDKIDIKSENSDEVNEEQREEKSCNEGIESKDAENITDSDERNAEKDNKMIDEKEVIGLSSAANTSPKDGSIGDENEGKNEEIIESKADEEIDEKSDKISDSDLTVGTDSTNTLDKVIETEKKSETDSNSSSDVMIGTEKLTKIDDNDDYLLYLEEILTKVHSEYYREYDEKMRYKSEAEEIKIPDLKEIIPKVRKCVLRGVNIVFSGVIPTNIPPEKNKLYNTAKSFGATITPDLVLNGSPKTTHLVAAKWGTVKVNKCIKMKSIWIVNINWLFCCAERWERVDERLYPLEAENTTQEKDKSMAKQTQETYNQNQSVLKQTPEQVVSATYATYDPITGKRIRSETQAQNTLPNDSEAKPKTDGNNANQRMLEESRQIQPHNMLDFSPLSMFSKTELQSMGKEVDDACSEGDAMSTGNTDSDSDIDVEDLKDDIKCEKRQIESSSDESNDGECPKGWNRNKRSKKSDRKGILELEERLDDSTRDSYDFENRHTIDGEEEDSTDNESIGSVDEEMALAVEREFLS